MQTLFPGIGAIFAAFAVIFGAFGAHSLKDKLPENLLNAFHTGVEYQMYHALALILVGVIMYLQPDNSLLKWGGYCFIAGILLFSGSLYGLSLTGMKFFGPITPLGGLAFIAGWLILAYALFTKQG